MVKSCTSQPMPRGLVADVSVAIAAVAIYTYFNKPEKYGFQTSVLIEKKKPFTDN